MKRFYTLKNILLTIFFLSFFIPLIAVILIIPSSYKKQFIEETDLMTESNLELFNKSINSYLVELQELATFPIFKKDLMNDLEKTITSSVNDDYEHGKNVNNLFKNVIPDFLRISRKDILSIVVIYSDGTVVYSNRNSNVEINKEYDFLSQDWYKDTVLGGSKINYIGSHKPEYFTYSGTLSVFSVARINQAALQRESTGSCNCRCRYQSFQRNACKFQNKCNHQSQFFLMKKIMYYIPQKK